MQGSRNNNRTNNQSWWKHAFWGHLCTSVVSVALSIFSVYFLDRCNLPTKIEVLYGYYDIISENKMAPTYVVQLINRDDSKVYTDIETRINISGSKANLLYTELICEEVTYEPLLDKSSKEIILTSKAEDLKENKVCNFFISLKEKIDINSDFKITSKAMYKNETFSTDEPRSIPNRDGFHQKIEMGDLVRKYQERLNGQL